MTARDAASLAANSQGIKQLGLFHYSPRYTDKELKLLLDEALPVFPASILLKDRQSFDIPFEE